MKNPRYRGQVHFRKVGTFIYIFSTEISNFLYTGLLSFRHLTETNYEDMVLLKNISYDVLHKFVVKKTRGDAIFHIMIKMKPKNHFSSLHFSAKVVGEDDNSKNAGIFVYLGEQLTVAYF